MSYNAYPMSERVKGFTIWARKVSGKTELEYSFAKDSLIWFGSKQQIIKFLTL